ncbi:MAG TPA: dihydrofolate reductase [Pyrinomonadaceae bacterium]|jgi:dihydrofolate reductase
MAIIGIVAVDAHGAIGRGGALPWHYPADLKFFKAQTTGHACVMGWRTWQTINRPLPARLNIVLSRTGTIEPPPGLILLRAKTEVLSLRAYLSCDLYIIGGAQIYRAFLPEIERWIVTTVPRTVADADTFMPADFLQNFAPTETRQLADDLHVTFYDRTRPQPAPVA